MKHPRTAQSIRNVYEREHFVQFYASEERLLENLSNFVGGGLLEGDSCVVVATEEHRRALDELLRSKGLDVDAARAKKQFVTLDAETTLAKFMDQILPNKEHFSRTVGKILGEVRVEGKTTRVFGEMVALLWSQGNEAAAILLEQFWNDLARVHQFTLFCGYPVHFFEQQGHASMLENISHLHTSAILPTPSSASTF